MHANQNSYRCTKCGNSGFTTAEMRAAGGFWSKIFDVQGSKYTAVICSHCKYTEFYKGDSSVVGNIFDFITN